MDDIEVRIACINAAANTPGNPNHVLMAREYYAFVTEGTETTPEVSASMQLRPTKGKGK
jgi:hypothetical protein